MDPALSSNDRPWMTRLVRSLLRPYRKWVLIVFAAMLVETVMSLAAPWPLKIVLDNARGGLYAELYHVQFPDLPAAPAT